MKRNAWGHVERVPDPTDGRAQIVSFPPAVLELTRHGTDIPTAVQRDYAKLTGKHKPQLPRAIPEELHAQHPAGEGAGVAVAGTQSGLAVLISLKKKADSEGLSLAICHMSTMIRRLFELTGLHRAFDLYETEEEAIAGG